jgi:hypothetical protein
VKLVPMSTPNGYEYLWPQIEQNEKRQTNLDTVAYASMRDFYNKPGQHGLILGGQYGSGKTTLLLWILGWHFHENRETCILRMRKSTFESLSILEKAPMRLFVPEGCIFKYDHPMLEIAFYNPNQILDILDNLAGDKINVIAHDQYAADYKSKFEWWGQFFEKLLEWKATHMQRRMGLYIDELGDLVPNKGESLCPEHTYYGNQIHDSIDAYRRSNIRMVCVTHSLVDLRKTFRNQFHYWFIKRTNRETVPYRFVMYGAGIIEKLENWEVIIKDVKGNFNRRPSPVWVFPENRSVYTKASPRMMLNASEQRYAWRLALANAFLKEHKFTYYDRMEAFGYRSKGSVVTLEKSFPLEECPYPIRFLKDPENAS